MDEWPYSRRQRQQQGADGEDMLILGEDMVELEDELVDEEWLEEELAEELFEEEEEEEEAVYWRGAAEGRWAALVCS